ncbi:MAG: YraN family protein [Pseudomonadota bacterium]
MRPHPGGARWEQLAARYLRSQGLRIIKQNYSTRWGEIDLIAEASAVLVFAEVRYRRSDQFGGAAASISPTKQRRLARSAQQFLLTCPQWRQRPCRFDVIAVSGSPFRPSINWIPNAFDYVD